MEDNILTENLRGYGFKFKTKPGVFSPKGLDGGTRLLIDSLEVKDETLIADLGSGNGILGFVLARLNHHGRIHLLDDHLRAVELAKKNAQLNKLNNIEVFLSDLFSAVEGRSYHQIFSNPPQQLGNDFLGELVKDCYKHLKPEGELWLVVKDNLKSVMERFLKTIFKNCTIEAQNRSYLVIKAIKYGN